MCYLAVGKHVPTNGQWMDHIKVSPRPVITDHQSRFVRRNIIPWKGNASFFAFLYIEEVWVVLWRLHTDPFCHSTYFKDTLRHGSQPMKPHWYMSNRWLSLVRTLHSCFLPAWLSIPHQLDKNWFGPKDGARMAREASMESVQFAKDLSCFKTKQW